jgi:hypothetical protein
MRLNVHFNRDSDSSRGDEKMQKSNDCDFSPLPFNKLLKQYKMSGEVGTPNTKRNDN